MLNTISLSKAHQNVSCSVFAPLFLNQSAGLLPGPLSFIFFLPEHYVLLLYSFLTGVFVRFLLWYIYRRLIPLSP